MALGSDGAVDRTHCVQGCGRLAFAPRFRDCCQACPVAHTRQCGHRQPPQCCYGCGRLANRPRHTSCCRQCPQGHTHLCGIRQGTGTVGTVGELPSLRADEEDWVWVAAEHGLFLARGTIIALPFPAGTLIYDDRGILPRPSGPIFICRLPRHEVRRFRREGIRHCFEDRGPGGAGECTGCQGHLCTACARECCHCATLFCATCIDEHACPRDPGGSSD